MPDPTRMERLRDSRNRWREDALIFASEGMEKEATECSQRADRVQAELEAEIRMMVDGHLRRRAS